MLNFKIIRKNYAPDLFRISHILSWDKCPELASLDILHHTCLWYRKIPWIHPVCILLLCEIGDFYITLKKIMHWKWRFSVIFQPITLNIENWVTDKVPKVKIFGKFRRIPTFCRKLENDWIKTGCTRFFSGPCHPNVPLILNLIICISIF